MLTIKENFNIPDPKDQALMKLPITNMLNEMWRGVAVNDKFLKMLVLTDLDAQDYWQMPPDHQVHERNSVKARTVLRQFVRDWADEGAQEREVQYGCLLEALERYLPKAPEAPQAGGPSRKLRVLAPGSGLSRLPFECARRGYAAQGNEFSYHMLQGCKWVLNETEQERSHVIFPYVLNLENRREALDHLRPVLIPDVCPSQILCPPGVQPNPEDGRRGQKTCYGPQSNSKESQEDSVSLAVITHAYTNKKGQVTVSKVLSRWLSSKCSRTFPCVRVNLSVSMKSNTESGMFLGLIQMDCRYKVFKTSGFGVLCSMWGFYSVLVGYLYGFAY